jgi:hypothetical protein
MNTSHLDKLEGRIRDMTRRTRGFTLQQLIKEQEQQTSSSGVNHASNRPTGLPIALAARPGFRVLALKQGERVKVWSR